MKERGNLEYLDVDVRIISEWIFKKKTVGRASTRMIWLRVGSNWRTSVKKVMNLGFYKMRGISWLSEKLSASQDGLCSMELVIRYHQFVSFMSLLSAFPVNGFSSCEKR